MHFLESVFQDVRFSFAGFQKSPLFAVTSILTLALGIGANTVIFSVTDASILHPLALRSVPDSGRVVMLWERSKQMSAFLADRLPARSKDIRQWQEQSHSFSEIGYWRDLTVTLKSSGPSNPHPQRIEIGQVSSNLLSILGNHTEVGRDFHIEDSHPGRDSVAIVSDALAHERFGTPADALAKTLLLDGKPYTVIGVLPPQAELPAMWGGFDQKKIAIFTPALMNPPSPIDGQVNCFVYARLMPGVSLGEARTEMNAIQGRLAQVDRDLTFFSGINVSPLAEEDVGSETRQALWTLQAAVGLVLLIACANVANLMLARAVGREREMAMRVAMGAGVLRLLRMMLTESLVLSSIAAILGILFSVYGVRLVAAVAPKDQHGLHEMRIDSPVLLFTCALTLLAALIFGLAPYLLARRAEVNSILSTSSRTTTGSSGRLRTFLIIGELALSTVLLVCAGLMIRTLNTLLTTDLGFQRDHLLSLHLQVPVDRFPSAQAVMAANSQLLSLVRSQAYTESAMLTSGIPMQSVSENSYEVDGRAQAPEHLRTANLAFISDGYFETLKMRVLAGRTFAPDDTSSGPGAVSIVNRAFALKNWGQLDVLGHTVDFGEVNGKPARYRIVGVVQDEHQLGPDQQAHAEFYLAARNLREEYLLIRTHSDPLTVGPAVRQLLTQVSPDLTASEIRSMDQALSEWIAPRRFIMSVLLAFAGLALVLASVGLYGVLAYSVSLQTREIGIRVALGAEPSRISAAILKSALLFTGVGILLGTAGSVALGSLLQSQLFGVAVGDPVTLATVVLLLLLVSVAASYLPARRASRVDPVIALRAE